MCDKIQEKQVMHKTIPHPLLTDAHPIPKQHLAAPSQFPTVYIPRMLFYGMEYFFAMEYFFGHVGSPLLAMPTSSFLCTCLWAEHGTVKSPWFRESTIYLQLWTFPPGLLTARSAKTHCSFHRGDEYCNIPSHLMCVSQ